MTPDDFWDRVEVGDPSECWLWLGPTTHNGYGRHHRGDLDVRAHRHAYALTHGEVPTGMQVDHACHVRLCVNPAHLQAVTPRENSENLAGAHRDSTTGVRGVYFCRRSQRYIAEVMHAGKRRWVGSYVSLSEAAVAVRDARNELMTNNLLDRTA